MIIEVRQLNFTISAIFYCEFIFPLVEFCCILSVILFNFNFFIET